MDRRHLRPTFADLPIGGTFYRKTDPRGYTKGKLLRKVNETQYEYEMDPSRPGRTVAPRMAYSMRRDTRIEYEGNREPHRASGSSRERDTPAARTLKRLHDGELYKAFSAMQVLEHDLSSIPTEDLRAPIEGFRDKRWMIQKIRTIRADLDTLRTGMAARIWREH